MIIKCIVLVGMLLMHTRVRFKLQFFEFEQGDSRAFYRSPAAFLRGDSPGGYPNGGGGSGGSDPAADRAGTSPDTYAKTPSYGSPAARGYRA